MEQTILAEQYLCSIGIKNFVIMRSSDDYKYLVSTLYKLTESSDGPLYIIGDDFKPYTNIYYLLNFICDKPYAIFDDYSWILYLDMTTISKIMTHSFINRTIRNSFKDDVYYLELKSIFSDRKNKRFKILGSFTGYIESFIETENNILTTDYMHQNNIVDDIYLSNTRNHVMFTLDSSIRSYDYLVIEKGFSDISIIESEMKNLNEYGVIIGFKSILTKLNFINNTTLLKNTVWIHRYFKEDTHFWSTLEM